MKRAPAARSGNIAVIVEDANWKKRLRGACARARRAATLALPGGKGDMTILLTSDRRMAALNHLFRGKNKPTNVLSFPAADSQDGYLGDIAVALGVLLREAKAEGKSPAEHLSHLVIHGTLHLLGYDHLSKAQANHMETLETAVLARFGLSDPYRVRAPRARRVPRGQRPVSRQRRRSV